MKSITLTATAIFLAGAVVVFGAITTDHDKSVDFGKYHTYAWIAAKGTDDLWTSRIKDAVNKNLSEKGWQQSNSGGDAAVSAFGSTKDVQTLNTFYDGIGGGWGWRRGWGGGLGEATTTVENTPVGTLVVDIFDGASKNLIGGV